MPKMPTTLGTNRTGIATSPVDSKRTIEGARDGTPQPSFDGVILESTRLSFVRDSEPVGTMPVPASTKGVTVSAMELLKGKKPTPFLDLLAERLAFERTGVRLYEALLTRVEVERTRDANVARDELERIRDDELRHLGLLAGCIERLGADPTAMTPGADVMGVAGHGLLMVVSDPRVTLEQGLKAVLVAELADTDSWLILADLAARLGHDDMATDFRQALATEQDHLARVRTWLSTAIDEMTGLALQPPTPAPEAPPPVGG